jgi:nucleotide-binding universal stress UspA family protein
MKFLVAYSSPRRSAYTLEIATNHAKAFNAELFLLKVIPDPKRIGVVAELIATDRPREKAESQIAQAKATLEEQGIKVSTEVRVGRVARTILAVAREINADMIFVGTTGLVASPLLGMPRDPIAHYLVDNMLA